jgi:hypothetical protein
LSAIERVLHRSAQVKANHVKSNKALRTQRFVLPKFPLFAKWYVSVEEAALTAGTETCSFLVHLSCVESF